MTLLQELQFAAAGGSVEISTVLRKAKILAARVHNPEFERWVNHELNGYAGVEVKDLPAYRVLSTIPEANLRNAGYHWQAAPVMPSFLPDNLPHWFVFSKLDPMALR